MARDGSPEGESVSGSQALGRGGKGEHGSELTAYGMPLQKAAHNAPAGPRPHAGGRLGCFSRPIYGHGGNEYTHTTYRGRCERRSS